MIQQLTLTSAILALIHLLSIPVGIFAFGHAAMQRKDAYTAADRMSKPKWLGLTGGGTVVLLLFGLQTSWIFWIAGMVAVLVYIVDVRPSLNEVQRGH